MTTGSSTGLEILFRGVRTSSTRTFNPDYQERQSHCGTAIYLVLQFLIVDWSESDIFTDSKQLDINGLSSRIHFIGEDEHHRVS